MTNPDQARSSVMTAATHPAETAADLGSEIVRGRSWRTPFLALGGTALMVAATVIVIVALVFVAYYLAK
jgi:hypothetical protein